MFELISIIVLFVVAFFGITYVVYVSCDYMFDDMPPYWLFTLCWVAAGIIVGYFVRSPTP